MSLHNQCLLMHYTYHLQISQFLNYFKHLYQLIFFIFLKFDKFVLNDLITHSYSHLDFKHVQLKKH